MPSLPQAFDLIAKNQPKNLYQLMLLQLFKAYVLKKMKKMRQLTAFTFEGTRYAFARCPFGIHSIPAQFQRLMNTILQPLIAANCTFPIRTIFY